MEVKRIRLFLDANRNVLLLVTVAVVARIVTPFIYDQPSEYVGGDTPTYLQTARQIVTWEFSEYEGVRPPGYPLLILLGGSNPAAIWFIQSLLAIATTFLIYLTSKGVGLRDPFALVTSLGFTLFLSHLFFESSIITETFTTFLTTLAVYLTVRLVKNRRASPWQFAAIAAIVAFSALVRPLNLMLVLLLAPFVIYYVRTTGRYVFIAAFGIPVITLIIGWSLFNLVKVDYFGITVLPGVNLSNHAGAFMEDADDSFGIFKQVYLEQRPQQIAEGGSHANTIFDVIPVLKADYGLTYAQISKEYLDLSLDLIRSHPVEYSEQVARSWARFWIPKNPWDSERVVNKSVNGAVVVLWLIQKSMFVIIEFLVLATFGIVMLKWAAARFRLNALRSWEWFFMLMTVVISVSVTQAITEFGASSRYSIPYEPLMLIAAVLLIQRLLDDRV